jgi:EAL and modified HD-GYP domain-containing signal transduction protein
MRDEEIFLGRQPILNKNEEIVAYDLLFQSDGQTPQTRNVPRASASVIAGALTQFGIDTLLGRGKGFIGVNEEILLSDAVELLPNKKMVLGIYGTAKIEPRLIQRSKELKKKGFSFALQNFSDDGSHLPLLDVIDVVKIDVSEMNGERLWAGIQPFKNRSIQLLAEKVERQEQFLRCRPMGFDLFQGYYFARPSILTQKRIDPAMVSLMKLNEKVMKDADTKEIEQIFKGNPTLSYNLLRLVNSVAIGTRQKITAISHAITMLGRQQLKRWVQLLLFTQGGKGGIHNPLVQTATLRGRLMELLAQSRPDLYPEEGYPDRAFMTGILSLIDVLLGTPMKEIVEQLNLTDDVRQALLAHEGSLGLLLSLGERQEEADFKGVDRLLKQSGLRLSDLMSAQRGAISWMNQLSTGF